MPDSKGGGLMGRTIAVLVSVVGVSTAVSVQVRADSTPQPIPAGFNFPTARATIDDWVKNENTTAERQHAWDIWVGMNQQTSDGFPIWETWKSDADVFAVFGQHLLAAHPKAKR